MKGRVKAVLATTLVVVIFVSLWESLVCWPSMIGCNQPWNAGWSDWLILFLGLLTGPFAPYYSASVIGARITSSVLLGYTITFLLLFLSPYGYFLFSGKRSIVALLVGATFWLVAGHLFLIAIYV